MIKIMNSNEKIANELLKLAKTLTSNDISASDEDVLSDISWIESINALDIILKKVKENIKNKKLSSVKSLLKLLIDDATSSLHELATLSDNLK